jgi:hypothetical protein
MQELVVLFEFLLRHDGGDFRGFADRDNFLYVLWSDQPR